MKTLSLATAALAGLLCAGAASASVTVTFDHPEHYFDMPRMQSDRDRILEEIDHHIAHLAAKLPADQNLKVEVLDVQLAGRINPRNDVRVLRGKADWPSMHLRYSLESNGKVLRSGDETISDMTYMNHLNRYDRSENLRYEKQMIDDWFKRDIAAPAG